MNFNNIRFEKNDKSFRIYNALILIIALSLFFLNNIFFKSIHIFFSFYFSDLLAAIVLFSFLNMVYMIKIKNIWILLIITAGASFIWEYVALFIKKGAVFDLNDVFCYFISCLIYICLIHLYEYKIKNSNIVEFYHVK